MSKRSLLLLLVAWNILLTGAIVWALSRQRVPERILKEKLAGIQGLKDSLPNAEMSTATMDTAALKVARIAYFLMDSVTAKYDLVKESAARVRSEGQRMEGNIQKEIQKAQARYNELVNKDHAYSTQAELKADQAEVEQLGAKIQQLQAESQDKLEEMQAHMLKQIAGELPGLFGGIQQTGRLRLHLQHPGRRADLGGQQGAGHHPGRGERPECTAPPTEDRIAQIGHG